MKMTPMKAFTPDYSPVVKMMAMQTRLMVETSQNMMKLAMLPWQGSCARAAIDLSQWGGVGTR